LELANEMAIKEQEAASAEKEKIAEAVSTAKVRYNHVFIILRD